MENKKEMNRELIGSMITNEPKVFEKLLSDFAKRQDDFISIESVIDEEFCGVSFYLISKAKMDWIKKSFIACFFEGMKEANGTL